MKKIDKKRKRALTCGHTGSAFAAEYRLEFRGEIGVPHTREIGPKEGAQELKREFK